MEMKQTASGMAPSWKNKTSTDEISEPVSNFTTFDRTYQLSNVYRTNAPNEVEIDKKILAFFLLLLLLQT